MSIKHSFLNRLVIIAILFILLLGCTATEEASVSLYSTRSKLLLDHLKEIESATSDKNLQTQLEKATIEKFGIYESEGNLFIRAKLKVNSSCSTDDLNNEGITVLTRVSEIISAEIPLLIFTSLKEIKCLQFVDIDSKTSLKD